MDGWMDGWMDGCVGQLLAFHKADLSQPDDDGLTPEELGRAVGALVKRACAFASVASRLVRE